ncbi:hypothetical protein [Chitinimonas sp.]|uniref:hypothetical protein n=1 Tax=Chitinimonas sp. TaxID=1934313 RepID=UPI0035AF6154
MKFLDIRLIEKQLVGQALVAGHFDLVPRGWAENEADPDGFIGILEQQAPDCPAQAAYRQFAAQREILADRTAPDRLQRYAELLHALEDQHLSVPLCQDRTLLWRRPTQP